MLQVNMTQNFKFRNDQSFKLVIWLVEKEHSKTTSIGLGAFLWREAGLPATYQPEFDLGRRMSPYTRENQGAGNTGECHHHDGSMMET